MVTPKQLTAIMAVNNERAEMFAPHLNAAMNKWGMDNAKRQCSFLAQVGHESGRLRYVRELASGAAYEGRKDLGNIEPGDGVKFRGRGLLQITGRTNYIACGKALGLDLINHPELLEKPEHACDSAGWFWKTHGLNELSDTGDQIRVTRRINGGTNGLSERLSLYAAAQKVIV